MNAGYGMLGSYENTASQAKQDYSDAAAVKQPEFAQIATRISCAADRIQGAADKLGGLADRLFGERPEAVSNGALQPSRPGALGTIDDMLELTERALACLHDQINRFDSLA